MKSRIAIGLAVATTAALGLTACSSGGNAPTTPAGVITTTTTTTTTTDAPAMQAASLKTADSSLGTIVTDGSGNVVYQYDADTQGADSSACAGGCLSNWPPVPGGADAPSLDGITGTVATITGTDGHPQLTLNGWPLYYYAGDSAAGDTNGQGVGGVWWVMSPAGDPIH
jgi:predicted lipoprotein with Yx(FWY)xxD motif